MTFTTKKVSITIMVTIFIAIICLPIFIMPTKAYADTYAVGDTGPAGGGVIFYVNGSHYLEAAPTDTGGIMAWSSITELLGTSTAIGTGQSNTTKILTQNSLAPASKACDDLSITYSGTTYADWFLPSLDELSVMWQTIANTAEKRTANGFADNWCWSSSEDGQYYAYHVLFSDFSGVGASDKFYNGRRVRAIRAFSISQSYNGKTESESVEIPWVRNHEMTCFQIWINEDNNFEFVFWWEYYNNNWVKIYDLQGNEMFSIDMPHGNTRFEAALPDGMYIVKTFHNGFEIPIQEFLIGKP